MFHAVGKEVTYLKRLHAWEAWIALALGEYREAQDRIPACVTVQEDVKQGESMKGNFLPITRKRWKREDGIR